MRVHGDGKSSTNTFTTWAIKGHDGLSVKLEYNRVKLFEVKVTKVSFTDEYENERARLEELKRIKPDKRSEEDHLEIERLTESVKAEEKRQETEQTQEAVTAFHCGMEVDPPLLHH